MATYFVLQTLRGTLASLESLGLPRASLTTPLPDLESGTPLTPLPFELFAALLREAMGHGLVPFEIGARVPFGAMSLVDYLAASAGTVEAALRSVQRHLHMITRATVLALEPAANGGLDLSFVTEPVEGRRDADEYSLGVLVSHVNQLAATCPFEWVDVDRAKGIGDERWVSSHPAPVRFGRRCLGVRVRADALATPALRPDPWLADLLGALVSSLHLGDAPTPFEQAIRARLRDHLAAGVPSLEEMARLVGTSARTLERRLRDQGRSYSEIVDSFREHEARRLLEEGGASILDVALALGYADNATFTRACRRWTGASPSDYRRAHRATPARARGARG